MSNTTTDPSRPMKPGENHRQAPSHIKFMPKKEGYVAASDIPAGGVITKITGIHSNLKGIPNRVALRTEAFQGELLILSKGDGTQLANEVGSGEAEYIIGEYVSVNTVVRKFNGQNVYGMQVRLHHGHVAGKDGLIRGPRVAKRPPIVPDRK